MDNKTFATSKNDIRVVYDPINSHASTHFADTPQIEPIVKKIIQNTVVKGESMEFETDTGRPVGDSDLVETGDSDEIVYAIRKNRERYARFTKSRRAQPSPIVTIRLERIGKNTYDLYSAWLGPVTPPFPGSPHETPESRPFWAKHALVWGTQQIQPGTETPECPW